MRCLKRKLVDGRVDLPRVEVSVDLYATLKRVLPLTLVQRQKQDGYCVLILVADVAPSSFVQITQRCPCKIGCQLFLSLMKYIDCAN